MRSEAGYDKDTVIGYLEAVGTRRADGKFFEINDIRVTDNHRQTISKWEQLDAVPLGRFDAILLAYGLMLWEYEDWAQGTFGDNGYIDTTLEAA